MSAEGLSRLAREAMAEGLNLAAAAVQEDAARRAPLEEGALRNSLVVGEASADQLASQVSSDLPYAVRQHEELGYRHPRGGEAKYLENAANQAARSGTIEQIMAQAVKRRFG